MCRVALSSEAAAGFVALDLLWAANPSALHGSCSARLPPSDIRYGIYHERAPVPGPPANLRASSRIHECRSPILPPGGPSSPPGGTHSPARHALCDLRQVLTPHVPTDHVVHLRPAAGRQWPSDGRSRCCIRTAPGHVGQGSAGVPGRPSMHGRAVTCPAQIITSRPPGGQTPQRPTPQPVAPTQRPSPSPQPCCIFPIPTLTQASFRPCHHAPLNPRPA